ncbi:MAG: sterol desaturase family protein [Planctomycetota bacterium]|jgi:sterol desaturase/sphingolipid hydroxylase (fatty acid hydroxylase superfamily)
MAYLTVLILPGIFVLLLLAEQVVPLRRKTRPLFLRLVKNLILTAAVFLVGSLIVKYAGLATSRWSMERAIGIALWIPLPKWGRITVGFLLMDLTFYYWHRANHRIRLLWRFHNVHHIDPDLDVSTSFRFHLVEIAYSGVFRVFQVLLIGADPLTYAIYETVFSVETMLHHSNVRLPLELERWLNKIIVTPRMHGVHHSAVGAETNSNYSVIFPWWDRLSRTLMLNVPQSSIKIGVPGYLEPEDNRFRSLLIMPFVKQKRYWCFADGKTPKSNRDRTVKATRMLP